MSERLAVNQERLHCSGPSSRWERREVACSSTSRASTAHRGLRRSRCSAAIGRQSSSMTALGSPATSSMLRSRWAARSRVSRASAGSLVTTLGRVGESERELGRSDPREAIVPAMCASVHDRWGGCPQRCAKVRAEPGVALCRCYEP